MLAELSMAKLGWNFRRNGSAAGGALPFGRLFTSIVSNGRWRGRWRWRGWRGGRWRAGAEKAALFASKHSEQ